MVVGLIIAVYVLLVVVSLIIVICNVKGDKTSSEENTKESDTYYSDRWMYGSSDPYYWDDEEFDRRFNYRYCRFNSRYGYSEWRDD